VRIDGSREGRVGLLAAPYSRTLILSTESEPESRRILDIGVQKCEVSKSLVQNEQTNVNYARWSWRTRHK